TLTPAAHAQDSAPPVVPILEGVVLEPVPSAPSSDSTQNPAPPYTARPEDAGTHVGSLPYIGQSPSGDAAQMPLPYVARGQNYAPPDPQYPVPLYSTRPENGGLYVGLQFLYFQQTMPIKDQVVAVRGFFDADGSVTGTVGQFVGSRTAALRAN